MIKCMSTNGLLLPKYAERIAELGVDTLTVTVNAVDPEIGKDIYGFVIYEGEVYKEKKALKSFYVINWKESRRLQTLEWL